MSWGPCTNITRIYDIDPPYQRNDIDSLFFADAVKVIKNNTEREKASQWEYN